MHITNFLYCLSLLQVRQLFQLLLFQEKWVNQCDFQEIEHQFRENILHHFNLYSFLKVVEEISLTTLRNYLKSFTDNFCDIAHPYKLITSKCLRYINSFLS